MNYDTNNEFTLLLEEQTFGNQKIDVIEELGIKCAISDFAILLGSHVYDEVYVDDDDVSLKGRTAGWCLSSFDGDGDVRIVNGYGDCRYVNAWNRSCGIRPVIPFDTLDIFAINLGSKGILEVVYGEYPQYAVDSRLGGILENEFSVGRLKMTGKTYTTDSSRIDSYNEKFKPIQYEEFAYNSKKYVRVKANLKYEKVILSNGIEVSTKDIVWLEVSPITWYVNLDNKLLISKILLASGVRFHDKDNHGKDFKSTEMYMFLNKYFAKDIIPSDVNKVINIQSNDNKTKKLEKTNAYNFNFNKISEEDIIKGAIESGVAVFLHGPSSEGKSARVKQIDPTCEIIYLRNASPESLNGKSIYNGETGEMIDVKPTWLKKVEAKCESEPDRLHVVFFDEITNALPSIQGIAFNIVLDREVNGIWKLPENARIVASGNEMEDSLAANQLAEPLFNRFAHVYIKTTTESWLKWASENGIHPAIYTFMAYKKGTVLRSEFDGVKPNADPRKWEMASKMLYATGKPEMIRSLVGEDITREFVAFCKTNVITLDDVLNDNYNSGEIKTLNVSERYATAMTLSQVDETNLEKVRNFASKLGGEYRAIFDSLWVHGDEERLEKIAELEQNRYTNQKDEVNIINDDVELTLLTKDEVQGNKKLNVLVNYGNVLAVTDLATITGADVYDRTYDNDYLNCYDNHYVGYYYTKTYDDEGDTFIVDEDGVIDAVTTGNDEGVIRPVLVSPSVFSYVYPNRHSGDNETYEVEFGEYPQDVASAELQDKLNEAILNEEINTTGRQYTFYDKSNKSCKLVACQEYEYKNEKYILVEVNYCDGNTCCELSNSEIYKTGEHVWLKVEPITWLIDNQNQRLISKYGLLSNVKFYRRYNNDSFEKSSAYRFLNDYMLNDMLQSYKRKNGKIKKLIK